MPLVVLKPGAFTLQFHNLVFLSLIFFEWGCMMHFNVNTFVTDDASQLDLLFEKLVGELDI